MKCRLLSALLVLIFLNASAEDNRGGVFSRSALSIWAPNTRTIQSPDRTKAILVLPPRDNEFDEIHTVRLRAEGREYSTPIGSWVNAEAGWSPDSKAFFVTYSDGGNIGTYHLKVFYMTPSGFHVIEPVKNGRKLFAPTCFEPESPNVAAIKWLGDDSTRLLIAVEVPPHSSCASMGTFRAFQIALPNGRVLASYDQLAAKKLFGNDMGIELREAEDACVLKPQTCVPTGLALPQR